MESQFSDFGIPTPHHTTLEQDEERQRERRKKVKYPSKLHAFRTHANARSTMPLWKEIELRNAILHFVMPILYTWLLTFFIPPSASALNNGPM